MSDLKHTPGPWFVGSWSGRCHKPEHGNNHPGLNGENPCVYDRTKHEGADGIASECGDSVVTYDYDGVCMSDADARLIASAPELLDALENMTIAVAMGWDMDGVVEVARAAIAKAKGQTQ